MKNELLMNILSKKSNSNINSNSSNINPPQFQMKKNPSDELTAAIKESEAMLNDPNTQKFDSVDALFADLDAEE